MMTCREVVEAVDGAPDGGRSDDLGQRIEEHLAACATCSAYVESYRQTIGLAKDALRDDEGAPGIPEQLVQKILSRRRKS